MVEGCEGARRIGGGREGCPQTERFDIGSRNAPNKRLSAQQSRGQIELFEDPSSLRLFGALLGAPFGRGFTR